jgi:cytochrome c-type biogenesis protein CcmH
MRFVVALTVALLAGPLLAATTPEEMLKDPVLEARARVLGKELRCLVCQNQSIDDSDADLADDLRRLVRERLVAGDSDQQIRDFLVARYGDFVLLDPPFRPSTWLLWAGPALAGVAGAAGLFVFIRRRGAARDEAPAPLSEAERKRLDGLLRADREQSA